jgi:hypothetical protein
MASRLVDDVQKNPPKVTPAGLVVQRVEGHRTHRGFRGGCPIAVSAERRLQGQCSIWPELLFVSRDFFSFEAAADPAPLDVGQVVDNTDERDQLAVRCPTRPVLIDPVEVPQHCTPEVTQPAEKKLSLVAGSRREPEFIVSCHSWGSYGGRGEPTAGLMGAAGLGSSATPMANGESSYTYQLARKPR